MLDEQNYRFVDGNLIIKLTKQETRALYYLIKNKKGITNPISLAMFVGYEQYDRYIAACVCTMLSNLRQKLKFIVKISHRQGIGYEIEYIGNH